MKTIKFEKEDIEVIAELLMDGEVVAFPTDTVFGLGVVYDNEEALDRLKKAKGRPENKPIPTMVADYEQLQQIADVDDKIKKIMNAFMPGALTLILKKKSCVKDYVTNGMNTIGIRMPDDTFVLDLLHRTGKPMLVTSANLSDYPTGTNDLEVLKQLDGRIDAIVTGEAAGMTASTILDMTQSEMKIVREGPITMQQIEECLKS